MSNYQRPLDYIDVATRLTEMREKFPDLTMTQVEMKFLTFGGKDWVVYTAAAYRTPDDQRPGIGTAWEPVPGPTNFTRDSEVQNAETAAWGRALIAIGASTKNGIASVEEVTNRTGQPPQQRGEQTQQRQEFTAPETTGEISPDIDLIMSMAEKHGDDFLVSLSQQFVSTGRLTDKQIEAGVKKAKRYVVEPRSMPEYEQEFEFAPESERF